MAITINATGRSLSRTTNLPTITGFTMMCWGYIVTEQDNSIIMSIGASASDYFYATGFSSVSRIFIWNGSSAADGSDLASSIWYHVAMTCAGTGANNVIVYVNGSSDITIAGNSNVTQTKMYFGNDRYDNEYFGGTIAAIKVWNAVLSQGEIANEMRCYLPIITSNLNTWLPCIDSTLANNALDMSGNGYNMTVGGTPTIGHGPPIPWSIARRRTQSVASASPPESNRRRRLLLCGGRS
jgi:hypothetical protein